jgi:hypothetical protein
LIIEKRPRHWAAEIAALPTLEQRQERLKKVPQEWQELVKTHLTITFFVKSHKKT